MEKATELGRLREAQEGMEGGQGLSFLPICDQVLEVDWEIATCMDMRVKMQGKLPPEPVVFKKRALHGDRLRHIRCQVNGHCMALTRGKSSITSYNQILTIYSSKLTATACCSGQAYCRLMS